MTSLDVALALLRGSDGRVPAMIGVGRPPVFLLPSERSVASAMCLAHNGLRSPRRRIARRLTAAGIRLGAATLLGRRLDEETQEAHGIRAGLLEELSQRMGTEIRVGIGLGRLDSYWKPVVQIFDRRGRDLAFAKVGWTPLTRELVTNEARMLDHLDGGRGAVISPRLLHSFSHGELQVAVTAPLPDGARRWPPEDLPAVPDALVALGERGTEDLAQLPWWQEVEDRVNQGAAPAGVPALVELLEEVGSRLGGRELQVGLQHGDWVPWNLARLEHEPRPVAWDWEYGRLRAPVGLDILHGAYQSERLLRGASPAEAFASAHRHRPSELALLHTAQVASRCCWAASFGPLPPEQSSELNAAATILRAELSGHGR
jgi:hypothetical protein